jgi:hypothetical protein
MDFKLKPITETSWILHNNGSRLAVITLNNNVYNLIGKIPIKEFKTLDELSEKLGGKVIFEEPEVQIEKEQGEINGYPIKHNNSFNIELKEYPSYTKTVESNNRFAAGYYAIQFSYGWTQSYCPKTNTLDSNNWIGPFRTKLEMLNAISTKKKEIPL